MVKNKRPFGIIIRWGCSSPAGKGEYKQWYKTEKDRENAIESIEKKNKSNNLIGWFFKVGGKIER